MVTDFAFPDGRSSQLQTAGCAVALMAVLGAAPVSGGTGTTQYPSFERIPHVVTEFLVYGTTGSSGSSAGFSRAQAVNNTMEPLKQSTARNLMVFMVDSSDHVTGKTGLTLTITASKDGAAFASISPTVTERGNGWYNLALTSGHTDTLGDLALHITGTGADACDLKVPVETERTGLLSAGAIVAATFASGAITASTFAANALDAVWSATTRTLSAAGVQAIWDAATSGLTTAGSIGKKLADWTILTSTTTADAVWNAVATSYNTALSMGNKLNSAASAGDPWTTALPGSYGAGSAGKIVGDNLNATVGSRAIPGDSMALTSGERTTLAGSIWNALTSGLTTVGSIGKLLVDNLNATVSSRLASASYTAPDNASVAAIKAKTDNLPAAPAATGDIPSVAAIADGVYDEAMVGHTTAGTYGDKLRAHLSAVHLVVVGPGSTTTAIVFDSSTGIDGGVPSSTDDVYNGRVLVFLTGNAAKQATSVSDYTGSSKTATVVAVTTAPGAGDTAILV